MATEAGHLFVKVGAETSGFDRGMKRVDKSLARVGTRTRRFAKIGTVALGGFATVGGAAIAKTGLGFVAMQEQAEIAFKTMLGDGKKAQKFLGQLQAFANKTPFEFEDLTRASQRLMALGFTAGEVIPTMKAVGDAVAGMGGGAAEIDSTVRALGQVQAKGRLMAEEMMQLTEAGTFSWKALAKELGVSVPKAMEMVTKGQVSADEAIKAFTNNSKKNFKGMMDQQSRSLKGMWSTLKDTFKTGAGQLMKPLLPAIKNVMGEVQDVMSKFVKAKTFRAKMNVIWDGLKDAGAFVQHQLTRAFQRIDWRKVWGKAQGLADGLANKVADLPWTDIWGKATGIGEALAARLGEAVTRVDWSAIGSRIGASITGSIEFGGQMIASLADWVARNRGVVADLGAQLFVAMIAKLIDVQWWAKNWDLALAVGLAAFGKGLGKFAARIGGSLAAKLGPVIGRLGGGSIASAIGTWAPRIGTAVGRAFSQLPSLVQRVFKAGLILTIVDAMRDLPGKVRDGFNRAKDAITGAVSSWYQSAVKVGARVVDGVRDGFKGVVDRVKSKMFEVVRAVFGFAGNAMSAAKQVGKAILHGVWNGIGDILGWVWKKMKDVGRAIVNFVGTAAGYAAQLGSAIVGGIVAGLGNLASLVYDKVKGGIQTALDGVKGFFRIGSPSKVWADEVGKPIADGIIMGYLNGARDLPANISDRVANAMEAARQRVDSMRDGLQSAFERVAEDAFSAFDARTDKLRTFIAAKFTKLIDQVNSDLAGKLSSIEGARGIPTPAEAMIASLEDQRTQGQLQSAIDDAKKALQDAYAGGEQDQITQALKRLADAELDQRLANLRKQAEAERAERDRIASEAAAQAQTEADTKIAALQLQQADEEKELDAQRALRRRKLQDQLDDLQEFLGKHPGKWKRAHKRIMGLFKDEFGPDFKTAGENLGSAFAQGLRDSFKDMDKAAQSFAKLIASYLKLNSPADKGPLSTLDKWWAPMTDVLIGGVDTGRLQGFLDGVGGPSIPGVATGAGGGGDVTVVNLTVQGSVQTARDLVDEIHRGLQMKSRRSGALFSSTPGVAA